LKLLFIFLGGGLGSVLRYGISAWLNPPPGSFPWGTLAANFLACLVLGAAMLFFSQRAGVHPHVQAMILIGFCGGFSTFSTFSLETFRLLENGQFLLALLYVLGSTLLCLLVLWGLHAFFSSS
jgi:CrcB protein